MKFKSFVIGSASLLMVAVPFASAQAFSPDRNTYTCNSAGQCIGADHVQFNSFTNNPAYGDERDFLTVRDSSASTTSYTNSVQIADGKTYVVRFYVHNNAQQDLAGTPSKYIAKDTAVRVALPTTVDGSAKANGYISASNATPGVVSDDVTLTSNGKFNLSYVPGSAKILTNGLNTTLSDNIVTSGATVGYSALDGNWPGCFDYSGWVTVTVKATSVPTPPVTPPVTPTPATPVTPTALPNTGPGSVVAIFAGAALIAGGFHYLWTRRQTQRG